MRGFTRDVDKEENTDDPTGPAFCWGRGLTGIFISKRRPNTNHRRKEMDRGSSEVRRTSCCFPAATRHAGSNSIFKLVPEPNSGGFPLVKKSATAGGCKVGTDGSCGLTPQGYTARLPLLCRDTPSYSTHNPYTGTRHIPDSLQSFGGLLKGFHDNTASLWGRRNGNTCALSRDDEFGSKARLGTIYYSVRHSAYVNITVARHNMWLWTK
ncbi:hypothetical protein J6590_001986 [Homalodisca vitripennis]|nr:hypothetical protein J6590_001986 [Homalodisca vitripennis]